MADGDRQNADLPSKSSIAAKFAGNFDETAEPAPPPATSTSPPSPSQPTHSSGLEPLTKSGAHESQPMTTTSSISSIASMQGANALDNNGPSPYGTRSRNRTGNARPNYAEDRELDTEYDWASTPKKFQSSSASTSSNLAQADENDGSGISTRQQSLPTSSLPNGKISTSSAPRDCLPGMSSFSVNPEPNTGGQLPSKKRKAPGTVPTVSTNLANNNLSSSTYNLPRKAAVSVSNHGARSTNVLSFETCQGYLKNGKLKADDDHIYLVCEPPGEPYYLARIMEFLHAKNDHDLPIDALRVNWYYRPRDIGRKVSDTRLIFASMHSDTCPLTSLRGKCRIAHRDDIDNFEEFRKTKDSFWYEKLFDRYIHRYYDVIPTSQVINVPARVKKVLDERWKFVIVEQYRAKELTSAIKSCKRCVGYCASNDSVDCAMCKNTYHMTCVRPPLLKKPARGFAWSCGPCSRKQERKLEARNTPLVGDKALDGEEEELPEEEEEDIAGSSGADGRNPESQASGPRPATAEQIAQAKLWPYRYLGIHCRVEDALDYDDRIYPRASSRLGPKHQANVVLWHGRPVELIKPAEIKRRYLKTGSHKKDAKLTRETVAALEEDKSSREKRPKWVMDEPHGYIHRGEDHSNEDSKNTAKVRFAMPEVGQVSTRGIGHWESNPLDPDQREKVIDEYMKHAKTKASHLGVKEYSTNFLDKALELLYQENFNVQRALMSLSSLDKRIDLKEPELNKEELKKFEEGVAKYGSELRSVSRMIKSKKHGEIVRFYYMWKKTTRGKHIWGNYEGRKGKKQAKQLDMRLVDDVADDIDDSAFDNVKAASRKRGFECKFCATRQSTQWRRAPGLAPGVMAAADPNSRNGKEKGVHPILALCQRCAGLWRKYGIQWENIDEVAKKVANSGGRAWRRKMDEEFLLELLCANEMSAVGISSVTAATAASVGVEVPAGLMIQQGPEGSKKRQKTDNQAMQVIQNGATIEPPKRRPVEKVPEPLVPEQPVIKVLPCAVCYEMGPTSDQLLACKHCRLTVHRNCYGITEGRPINKWSCDTCSNDKAPQISTSYDCVLCPVTYNEQELMEPPKVSHKKKSDRDREKERLEREMVLEATEQYHRRQDDNGRPRNPREPFKKTAGNRWVHVTCAIWHPEIKFSNAPALEAAEGFQSIPAVRYEQICKLCKTNTGACTSCHQCGANFHVACAIQDGYQLGFDVTPVKGSRKDVVSTVTMGSETGNVTAVIYCREHTAKSIVHPISEMIENSPLNALQLFARTYKQADLSLTGTVRKAAIINSATRGLSQAAVTGPGAGAGHRGSVSAVIPAIRSSRVSPAAVTVKSEEVDEDGDRVVHLSDAVASEPSSKECASCATDASPKWHKVAAKVEAALDTTIIDRSTNESQPQSQTAASTTDSRMDGLKARSHEGSDIRVTAPTSDSTNGINGNSHDRSELANVATPHSGLVHGSIHNSELHSNSLGSWKYLCHKCHLRKLRNPTPTQAITSMANGTGSEAHMADTNTPSPPRSQQTWSLPSAATAHDRYSGWPAPEAPHFSGPPGLSNGVAPSPPSVPPPPTHYAPPSNQYPSPGYRHSQPQHDPISQYSLNGGPRPYPMPRVHPASLATASFPQHAQAPSRAHVAPLAREIISPRTQQHQSIHGPHGPPRAEENPFATPYQSQPSPRQEYPGIYGSPRGNVEPPESPPVMLGRPGVWPSAGDGPMTNGASASPSLRNLLH